MAKASDSAENFMEALEHPLAQVARALRVIVKSAHADLSEGIKWNAPSYRFGGDDRVTFNLSDKAQVRLIFHCGAKKGARKGKGRPEVDDEGLLTWAGDDRAIASFRSLAEVKSRKRVLVRVIRQWVAETASE